MSQTEHFVKAHTRGDFCHATSRATKVALCMLKSRTVASRLKLVRNKSRKIEFSSDLLYDVACASKETESSTPHYYSLFLHVASYCEYSVHNWLRRMASWSESCIYDTRRTLQQLFARLFARLKLARVWGDPKKSGIQSGPYIKLQT